MIGEEFLVYLDSHVFSCSCGWLLNGVNFILDLTCDSEMGSGGVVLLSCISQGQFGIAINATKLLSIFFLKNKICRAS